MKQKHRANGAEPKYRRVEAVHPAPEEGLSPQQVLERQKNGLRNQMPPTNTKPTGQIVRENILTFFNLIFVVLALALVLSGSSVKNMTFLVVAVFNTLIGIYQELRAKRAVDKLTLVAAGSLTAIRSGQRISVRTDQLVRDDIVEFAAGNQICADAVLRQGQLQVNEALLTGEADAIVKNPGDALRSGSYVISGRGLAELTAVGADSYAAKLAFEARRDVRSTKSEMMKALTRLITVVGIALIPMGIILFIRQLQAQEFSSAVDNTVAALIGMIPEGLYLLTSVAMAASALKLSKKRVLLQDMNCIETLARVDVLCVDKTGTITQPGMEVMDVYPLCKERFSYENIEEILAAFYHGQEPDNETAKAMSVQFSRQTSWKAQKRVAFSSEAKWSGADFGENGSYLVGAPEFILGDRYDAIRELAELPSVQGCRVLLLASYEGEMDQKADSALATPIALIYLSNRIRPDAPETFRYFAQQGVSVRVISGDNPHTVSQVAQEAGIEHAERYVDATTLRSEQDYEEAVKRYTVFGRVTPEQKRLLVGAFHAQGHTVAMTGDGVNDVLALKDADCGIAMASGAQAASQIAQIVLLDSQFSAMPEIVAEGRRVINNIQRAATLFLVKNIFSFALTLLLLFIDLPYPLQPIHLSLISALTIGVPSFFLALEPNYAIVTGKFMRNVIRRALPGGLTNVALVLLTGLLFQTLDLPMTALETVCVWILSAVGFLTLYHISKPFTALRRIVFFGTLAAMLACLLFLPGFFELAPLTGELVCNLILLLLACPTLISLFMRIFDNRMDRHDQKNQQE